MTRQPFSKIATGSRRRLSSLALALTQGLLLSACTSHDITTPDRSAVEQLLISTATDRAADAVAKDMALAGRLIYVDGQYLDGTDKAYAQGALRDAFLRHGALMATSKDKADVVVEVRAGALSMDTASSMVGVPSMSIPVPLSDTIETPELSLFKKALSEGVAKLAATAYSRKTGVLVASSGPEYGFSNQTDWTLLLLVTWETADTLPDEVHRPEAEFWK